MAPKPPNLLTWDQAREKAQEGDALYPVTFLGKIYYELVPGGSQALKERVVKKGNKVKRG